MRCRQNTTNFTKDASAAIDTNILKRENFWINWDGLGTTLSNVQQVPLIYTLEVFDFQDEI